MYGGVFIIEAANIIWDIIGIFANGLVGDVATSAFGVVGGAVHDMVIWIVGWSDCWCG